MGENTQECLVLVVVIIKSIIHTTVCFFKNSEIQDPDTSNYFEIAEWYPRRNSRVR